MGKGRKLRRAEERAKALAGGESEPEGKRETPVKESKARRTDPYRRNVYVTDEEWEGAEPILKEAGLTRSRFITLCFRWVIRNRERGMRGFGEGPLGEVFGAGGRNDGRGKGDGRESPSPKK